MTSAFSPEPDLSAERAQVRALIAGSGLGADPHLEAAAPLRTLPPALEAKLATRAGAPAAQAVDLRRRVVGPSAALAALDAIAVVVAAVTGHVVLAVVAAVLLVPLAGLAVLGARYDAGRLTVADRRQLALARRWRGRPWTVRGEERGLVVAAVDAARRIAGSPAWRSGRLDEQRVRLDLATELDQIDEQAHRIAAARAAGADVGDAWNAALDRVAALTAYANELDGYARRRRAELARQDPVATEDLLAGAALDELGFEHLVALTIFLNAQFQDGAQP